MSGCHHHHHLIQINQIYTYILIYKYAWINLTCHILISLNLIWNFHCMFNICNTQHRIKCIDKEVDYVKINISFVKQMLLLSALCKLIHVPIQVPAWLIICLCPWTSPTHPQPTRCFVGNASYSQIIFCITQLFYSSLLN